MSSKHHFPKALKKQTLAEQVASTVKEAILSGEWEPGEALPTEPELAEQFGVSRAVIRDATRMLVAQGLVDAQHGRGVFVTESQIDAFGDALLLALRRVGASVWDVEHFEQIVYPEVFALAAQTATDEEIETIRQTAAEYLDFVRQITEKQGPEWDLDQNVQDELIRRYRSLINYIFRATHNQVFELLALPLLRLRTLRNWQDEALDSADLIALERGYIQVAFEAIASRDPEIARATMRRLMILPPQAQEAMQAAPIGEVPQIPVARRTDRN